jgi:signal peptidase I
MRIFQAKSAKFCLPRPRLRSFYRGGLVPVLAPVRSSGRNIGSRMLRTTTGRATRFFKGAGRNLKSGSNGTNQTNRWWLLLGLGLIALLLLLVQSHFRLAMVIGPSMRPGLRTGNLLLVDKRAYCHSAPRRGDVVLARHRDELIIKRVVGLPGEEVELKRGHLFVNGEAVIEHHAIEPGPLDIGPGRLFQGKFALLGDNRGLSSSQIVHAVVAKDQIIGKVLLFGAVAFRGF